VVCVQVASFYSQHFADRIGGGGASGTSSPATPRKRKNSDGETTPAKKRATPKKKQAATPPSDNDDGDGDDVSQNMQEFSTYTVLGDKADANKMGTVKNEEKWESGYA
jgi:hypothetical protein